VTGSDIFLAFMLLNAIPGIAALIIIFVMGYKRYKIEQSKIPPEKRKRSFWKRLKW